VSFRDLDIKSSYSAVEDRLNGFYIPVLKEAVSYDRVTGYFRSSSLQAMAAGLTHFIGRRGTMRLIAGAELEEQDYAALTEGEPLADVLARRLLEDPLAGVDIVSDHRLEVLAWLLREGRLHIKIGVPVDHLGHPVRREETQRYFHSKYGIIMDGERNRIAFEGSNNETQTGLALNHEGFSVFPSWFDQVWTWNGQAIVKRFEEHWHGRPDKGWAVVPLPEAVAQRLIARVKNSIAPPAPLDPEETRPPERTANDEIRLRFIAAAPRLRGGTGVGFVTAGVEPWPHQLAIAQRAVATFPRSYLLADEVGLGKTIEAGLVLRELLVSGKARTALLLTPASVLRQWQEELDEKLGLRVPRFDTGRFLDRDDREVPWTGGTPWSAFPVILASSHLARRRDRHRDVLAAGPWDVVLVDEAHHARRGGAQANATPNRLLALLRAMKAANSWRALYLASATPMQMYAHEAWDLLELLGLTGGWASSADNFVRYYHQLRDSFDGRDWHFLQRLAADFFADPAVQPDPVVEEQVRTALGLAGSNVVRKFHLQGLSADLARELPAATRGWMDEWLRHHTPMRDRVFRTTRPVLREYKAHGLLPPEATIPSREVRDRFIPMTKDEDRLYRRIEAYISRYYDGYLTGPKTQKPLGFIMTVYRRRLTSSFLAIERSLRRRREALLGGATARVLLDADDLATLESSILFDLEDLPETKQKFVAEANELAEFLADLERRPPDESKMAYLHDELEDAFRSGHQTAVVFTQYTDTMDYLRQQLDPWYGAKVICYSGRGGERWNERLGMWRPVSKAEVKTLFRQGDEVKILLGTDALSEGLNLQTCGKLINYDMPWNFMRVEQRIGRLDRINGRPIVEVSNYFYEGTVEEQIYRGIREDYDWFTDVVGPAQPVLSQVETIIEQVAMRAPGADRDAVVRDQIAVIRAAIEQAKARGVTLADVGGVPQPAEAERPVINLADLERVLLSARGTAGHFRPHPTIHGAYLLEDAEKPVTFRRTVLDAHAPDVALLTYGTPEYERLIRAAGVIVEDDKTFLVNGQFVDSLDELERRLAAGSASLGTT
jgi:hypothetical protein